MCITPHSDNLISVAVKTASRPGSHTQLTSSLCPVGTRTRPPASTLYRLYRLQRPCWMKRSGRMLERVLPSQRAGSRWARWKDWSCWACRAHRGADAEVVDRSLTADGVSVNRAGCRPRLCACRRWGTRASRTRRPWRNCERPIP